MVGKSVAPPRANLVHQRVNGIGAEAAFDGVIGTRPNHTLVLAGKVAAAKLANDVVGDVDRLGLNLRGNDFDGVHDFVSRLALRQVSCA